MFNKLFSVCLLVENLDESTHFYHDELGLEILNKDTGYVSFRIQNIVFSIFEKTQATSMYPEKYMNKAGAVLIGLQVKDVNQQVRQLEEKGVKIIQEPKLTPWGQTVAYFQDPDSNMWEISGDDFKE